MSDMMTWRYTFRGAPTYLVLLFSMQSITNGSEIQEECWWLKWQSLGKVYLKWPQFESLSDILYKSLEKLVLMEEE